MEQDRYNTNHYLFITGMISLILSLAMFGLTLYVLPHLLFGITYDVPSFISDWKEWLHINYQMNESKAAHMLALLLFTLSLIFALIAYFSSNKIDNSIYKSEIETQAEVTGEKSTHRETMILVLKMLFIIVLVYIFAQVFQWFMDETS